MFDWIADSLNVADSAFAVIGSLIVAAVFCVKPVRRRLQRRPSQVRRRQAEVLDQLGLGRPLETIEKVLGSPHLRRRSEAADGQTDDERIYRLQGAWVVIRPLDGVVAAYSITITDADLYYDTDRLTRTIVPVCLGRSTFADDSAVDDLEIYARMSTFHRFYDYGCTAAGGQHIWLAFNPCGAGRFDGASEVNINQCESSRKRGAACDLARITVNTIAICDWDLRTIMMDLGVYGPHPDAIR